MMWRTAKIILLGVLCMTFQTAGLESHSTWAATISAAIALSPVVQEEFDHPVYVTHARDGSGRLFIVEQPGRVRILEQGLVRPKPFLDITERVRYGGEQGLLGLAFHPSFKKNGRFFVNYVRRSDGATIIAEFRVTSDPNVASSTEQQLLTIAQPYPNHKGGMVEFGPDGFLYLGLGDGGSGGDPGNRGQNTHELLGKILRLDVDRAPPYAIPADNPFAQGGGGRSEIFAYGLRNPWRFSFDRDTGQLWAGDVGQNEWEEIDVVKRGGNYGWRVMEGRHCYVPRTECKRDRLEMPIAEYGHDKGRCSVTGGYVYRGSELTALRGAYLFGDFCSGEIFMLADGMAQPILKTKLSISSFGEGPDNELFVVAYQGTIHRLVSARDQTGR